jgi:hypothetical protein
MAIDNLNNLLPMFLLSIVYCLLPVAYYLLPIAYCHRLLSSPTAAYPLLP